MNTSCSICQLPIKTALEPIIFYERHPAHARCTMILEDQRYFEIPLFGDQP